MKLIIVLVIVILCFMLSVYNIQNRCPPMELDIKYLRGRRLNSSKYSKEIGIPTIHVGLDRDLPCGVYTGKSIFDKVLIFVSKKSPKLAYIHFYNHESRINTSKVFDFWDVSKIIDSKNEFINTYNRGCC